MDNTPIHGCSGCSTTAGRMGCGIHGAQAVALLSPVLASPTNQEQRIANLEARVMALEQLCAAARLSMNIPMGYHS